MDGLRLLWIGGASELATAILDAVERDGGWVSRTTAEAFATWRTRDVDVALVDATPMHSGHLDDVLNMVRRRASGVHVFVITADLADERHGVTTIRDDVGARDRILAAITERRPTSNGCARQAVLDALRAMLEPPRQSLSKQLRDALVMRILDLGAKDTASTMGIEADTVRKYWTQGRDRLVWPSLDLAMPLLLEKLTGDLESLIAELLEDAPLAAKIIETLRGDRRGVFGVPKPGGRT